MGAAVPELCEVEAGQIPAGLFDKAQPVILKGLVSHWPGVVAAQQSRETLLTYLRDVGRDQDILAFKGHAEAKGRFFYTDDLQGLNFDRITTRLFSLLEHFQSSAAEDEGSYLYMGSTAVDECFPGFRAENDLPLAEFRPVVSAWMGGQSRIAAHFDVPENMACVVAGKRRFTLFPPEQVANLYVGPLDFTPAGQAISLVDFENPDLDAFPRFEQALEASMTAELEPGDVLYLPSMWWHHVEAQEPFNLLINYWWNPSPYASGNPLNVLIHALMSIRDLPPAQRQAWRELFEYYVFDGDEEKYAHMPPERLGVLGKIDKDMARQLRAMLRSKLSG